MGDGERRSCRRRRRVPQLRFHIQSPRLHLSDLPAGEPSPPSSPKTTELIIFLPAVCVSSPPPAPGLCPPLSLGSVTRSRPVPFAGRCVAPWDEGEEFKKSPLPFVPAVQRPAPNSPKPSRGVQTTWQSAARRRPDPHPQSHGGVGGQGLREEAAAYTPTPVRGPKPGVPGRRAQAVNSEHRPSLRSHTPAAR